MYKRYQKTIFASVVIAVYALMAVTVVANDRIVLPDFGDPSGRIITPVQEKELGEAFFRNLHYHIRINQDPEIQDYIQTLGRRLAEKSDAPERAFHFFVVLDPAINAFAGPGGYIGVNSGLIVTTESESEIASVMAHEIAHVTQRHLNRTFEAAKGLTLPLAAATLAAVLIGTQSAELGHAALIATQAASVQYQLNFTRDNEQEADRIGMQALVDAKFDPRSMPVFFERLQQSSRYYGKEIPEFLRTHPVNASRIADSRGRAEKFPYRQYPDSFAYLLTKASLRVLTSATPQAAIKFFTSILEQGTEQQRTVAHYGLALALESNSQHEKARQILQPLLKKYPEESRFANAMGQAFIKSGNFERALNYYETALNRFPNNRAMTLAYVKALLQSGNPGKAQNILVQYRQNRTTTPEIYELLAHTYRALGSKAESHRHLAEYYYHTGQTRLAITQLKIAQEAAQNDFHLNAILEARRKVFELEEKERDERKLR